MPDTLSRVENLEAFAVGTYDGQAYGPAELQKIVDNFSLLSVPKDGQPEVLRVPVTVGHAPEGQEPLAVGWVDAIRLSPEGDKLLMSLRDVQSDVAEQVRSKQLVGCSIELYTDFTDNAGVKYGLVCRAIALLGGSQPKSKGLAALPIPEPAVTTYQERLGRGAVRRFSGRPLRYSEKPMKRKAYNQDGKWYWPGQQLTAKFADDGLSTLAGAVAGDGEFAPVGASSRADNLAWLAENGFDVSLITEATPDALISAIRELLSGKSVAEIEAGLPPDKFTATKFAERRKSLMTQYREAAARESEARRRGGISIYSEGAGPIWARYRSAVRAEDAKRRLVTK